MKKLIVASVFFISMSAVKAQDYDFADYQTKADVAESEKDIHRDRQKMKDNQISSIKVFTYKSDSAESLIDGYRSAERNYDAEGNMTEFRFFKKNGKIKEHYKYQYDTNGKDIGFEDWKSNGNLRRKLIYSYDSSGNLTDQRDYWRKPGDLCWHSIANYDNKQNLLELKFLGKNDSKDWGRFVYTYYPDGSKKQTIEYGSKNKVRHIWNFDCNPVGKLDGSTLKDTSKICVRYETDKDGNKIKIKEENTNEGKYRRIISKYNQSNNLIDVAGYDSKERMKYHSHSTFDGKNNITEYIVYRRNSTETKQRNIYHYDTSGNLTELLIYKKSALPDHILKFNYLRQQ